MLTQFARQRAQALLNFLAKTLAAMGFTPNGLTLIGFIGTCGVGVVLATGNFFLGGLLIIITSVFDALDGSLARLTNRTTPFGAFLDSTTDRFGEGALFLGLLIWFLSRGVTFAAYVIYLAMLGSLLVSYARARAEGIGVECKEGLLTRLERIALLAIGLLLTPAFGDAPILIALAILALFSNLTAVQRIWVVYRATR